MKKNKLGIVIIIFLLFGAEILSSAQNKSSIYTCTNGNAAFLSDAPLELIKAATKSLTGAINISDRSFSFQIPTKTFEGFNSSLQRVHFNEDYMETELYPNSTFKGRIIEDVDLSVPGVYKIRAKGKMYIHGVENDRIVRCDLTVGEKKIDVQANFTVFLADHKISIPSIVNQKIAEEVKLDINLTLIPAGK